MSCDGAICKSAFPASPKRLASPKRFAKASFAAASQARSHACTLRSPTTNYRFSIFKEFRKAFSSAVPKKGIIPSHQSVIDRVFGSESDRKKFYWN
jgi:hypothetical protein